MQPYMVQASKQWHMLLAVGNLGTASARVL